MLHHWLYQMCSRELAAVRDFNLIPWNRACCVIVWHYNFSYYLQTQTKNDFLSHQITHRNGVQIYAIVAACRYSFIICHWCVIWQRRYSLPAQFTVRSCPLLCTTVIKKYGECCCRVRSNGKAGIFNTGSGASNLINSVWQVSTCSVHSVGCELRLREGVF